MQRTLNKICIVSSLLLLPFISISQYQLIKFSSSTISSQATKRSSGATSHFFYFSYGDGAIQRVGKKASELERYIKIAPEALSHIKFYNKYRKRSKLCNVTQIFSAIILVPGIVGCAYGIGDDGKNINFGIAIGGGLMAVAGFAGYIYFNNRTDVLLDKAEQELVQAVETYNKYIIDNKLTFEN